VATSFADLLEGAGTGEGMISLNPEHAALYQGLATQFDGEPLNLDLGAPRIRVKEGHRLLKLAAQAYVPPAPMHIPSPQEEPPVFRQRKLGDGPTLEEWMERGYARENYPPQGYSPVRSPANPDGLIGSLVPESAINPEGDPVKPTAPNELPNPEDPPKVTEPPAVNTPPEAFNNPDTQEKGRKGRKN